MAGVPLAGTDWIPGRSGLLDKKRCGRTKPMASSHDGIGFLTGTLNQGDREDLAAFAGRNKMRSTS